MTPSRYSDFAEDMKARLADLHERGDRYQTFDLHVELAMGSNLLVYETRKQKGQIDTMAYARTPDGDRPVSPAAAYERVLSFLAMQHHIALSGEPMLKLHEDYPHAVINVELRAKGAPSKSSTRMILVGVDDAEDAGRYVAASGEPRGVVSSRPYASKRLWEWK